jgi:GntR family transcriptional activator of glc operon
MWRVARPCYHGTVVIPVVGAMEQTGKRQLADVVVERIEKLIVDGVLKQGQTLPSERRLTE